jgi:hypothetical protein
MLLSLLGQLHGALKKYKAAAEADLVSDLWSAACITERQSDEDPDLTDQGAVAAGTPASKGEEPRTLKQ